MVLIGSNIPHLNFDYGVETDYNKEVLHLSPNFKNTVFNEIPELQNILTLFDRSQCGIAFGGETKTEVKEVTGTDEEVKKEIQKHE